MITMLDYMPTFGRLILSKVFNKRYPLSATHIITTRCNYRCTYCNMWKSKYKEMTTKQIFKMLDEFSEMGLKRYGISGGEPLLRNDIGEIINYAKKKKIKVSLFTNGFLVSERIKELTNLDLLLMSLDGNESENDKQRGKGSYKKTLEAIKSARHNKINVVIGVTLTKNNFQSIKFIAEKSKEMGFSILIQPVYYYPKYSSNKNLIENLSADYRNTIKEIIELKRKGFPFLNSITYLKKMINPYKFRSDAHCYASKLFCAVSPDGGVSPCFKIYAQEKWPNGAKLGFKNAFLKIPKKFKCCNCFSYATTEFNLMYSLNPEAMFNFLKNILPFTFKKNEKLNV